MLVQETKHFQVPEFLSAEALGVYLARRCASCRNCKECQFRTSAISFKEDQEYQAILDGLKFDEGRKKWNASYPFFIPLSVLRDNYQVLLIKQNRGVQPAVQGHCRQGRLQGVDSGRPGELEGALQLHIYPWWSPSRPDLKPPLPSEYA